MPPPRRSFLRRHPTLLAVLWLLVLPFVFAPGLVLRTTAMGPERVLDSDALFGVVHHVRVRPYDDSTPIHLDYPRDAYLASRVRAGHVDLWNPLQGFGVPLLPGQGGVLFPLRLLYYAWPSAVSYVVLRLLRLFVAGLGAFLLARCRRLSIPGAVGAATLFEICGGMVAQAAFMTTSPIAMLPWVLLGMELLRRRRWRVGLITTAVAVALTIVGGHQTLVAVTFLGASAYALGAAIGSPRSAARVLGAISLATLLGLLMSSPVLFQFIELLKHGHSYKWTAAATHNWHSWVLATRRDSLIDLAAPLVVGPLRDKWLVAYPYVLQPTVGLITCGLAWVCIACRRWSAPLLSLFVAGLIFAFVPPGFSFIGHTRFLRDILPRYFWPLLVLPITQWAGRGVDIFAAIPRVARLRGRLPSLRLAWAALVGSVGALAVWGLALYLATDKHYRFVPFLTANEFRVALPPLILASAMAASVALLRRRPKALRAALLAAAALELALYVRPLVDETPSVALGRAIPAPVIKLSRLVAKQHGRIASVNRAISIAQTPMLAHVSDSRMTSALAPERYSAYIAAAGARVDATWYSLPPSKPAFIDLCSVRYVLGSLSRARYLNGDRLMPHVFNTNGASIYENRGAAPRARLVHRVEIAPDLPHAERALRAGLRGRRHLAGTALSDTAIVEPVAGASPPRVLHGGPGEPAQILHLGADRVEVRTSSREPGYLVLADQYYPGWEAWVDGRRQPIYPAYVAFRAVYVAAGTHDVVFRYRPTSVELGFAGLVLGLLGLVLIAKFMKEGTEADA